MKQGDKPEPQKSSITFEKVGDYWVTGHFRGTYMGLPFEGQSTQGYSPTKKSGLDAGPRRSISDAIACASKRSGAEHSLLGARRSHGAGIE